MKRRSLRAPFLLLLLAMLIHGSAQAQEGRLQRFMFFRPAMGSVFTITLYAPDEATASKAAEAAFHRVESLNAVCSDYLPESDLMQLCKAGQVTAAPDLWAVLQRSLELAALTDGAFDITLGHCTQLWRRAKRKGALPAPEVLAHVRSMVDWRAVVMDAPSRRVTLKREGMLLDLGGIAKGFAADAALKVLREHGCPRAIAAASGDMAIGDPPPGETGWDIALRTFEAVELKDKLLHVRLSHCGVSTSGDLHQSVEIDGQRYSHIIDPATGLGLTQHVACSVIAPDATTSDAMATAMCVMPVETGFAALARLPGTSARHVRLGADGRQIVSPSPTFPPAHTDAK